MGILLAFEPVPFPPPFAPVLEQLQLLECEVEDDDAPLLDFDDDVDDPDFAVEELLAPELAPALYSKIAFKVVSPLTVNSYVGDLDTSLLLASVHLLNT